MKPRLFEHRYLTSRLIEPIHTRFRIPIILSSFLLFGLPPYLTGFLLWLFLEESTLVSYGFLLAFLWLALCPYLMWMAEDIADNFLKDFGKKVVKKEDLENFVKWVDTTGHRGIGYLLGAPFAIGADYLSFLVFPNIHPLTRIFLMGYISLLLLLAGMGFWGVISLIRTALLLKRIEVRTNPFDPDRFGGLEFEGSLCIKVTVLFSTGSLVLPLAFEAMQKVQYGNAAMLLYLLTTVYVGMIIVSFFIPTFALHDLFVKIKRSHLSPVSQQINVALEKCLSSGTQDEKKRFFDLISFYKEIDKMKVWPFDLPVILKLLGSVSLPIVISLVQLNLERILSLFQGR